MRLELSSSCPLKVSITDPSTGQLLYKVKTKENLLTGTKTSKIHRVIPGNYPMSMQNQTIEIGSIEHHDLSSSKIMICGRKTTSKELFKKDSSLWSSQELRSWTAMDGQEYTWDSGGSESTMFRKSDTKRPLVTYHSSKSHYFSSESPEKAALEVSPECHHILDEIIVTYVHIERKRQDREILEVAAEVVGAVAGWILRNTLFIWLTRRNLKLGVEMSW